MDAYYQGTYRDEHGEENIVIHNDGRELRMTVRGETYVSDYFDDFVKPEGITWVDPYYKIDPLYALHDYTLAVDMPISVEIAQELQFGILHYWQLFGPLNERNIYSQYESQMTLEIAGESYEAQAPNGYWDEFLPNLQKQLPKDSTIKCCATCAYSEPQPGGGPLFGALGCFRNKKEEIRRVKNMTVADGRKGAMFSIWRDKAQWVQEIYLCHEFERFIPDTDKNA